jgi:hypothetical protein
VKLGETVKAKGYVTQLHFVRAKTGPQLEAILGFRADRLGFGWALLFLMEMPKPDDFEFRGMSQMSGGVPEGHREDRKDRRTAEERLKDAGTDLARLKQRIIDEVFATRGIRRLCKVIPNRDAFGSRDYPPGADVPQWELVNKLRFKVVGLIPPGGRNWVSDALVQDAGA